MQSVNSVTLRIDSGPSPLVDLCASSRVGHRRRHSSRKVARQQHGRIRDLRQGRDLPQRDIPGKLAMDLLKGKALLGSVGLPGLANPGHVR